MMLISSDNIIRYGRRRRKNHDLGVFYFWNSPLEMLAAGEKKIMS